MCTYSTSQPQTVPGPTPTNRAVWSSILSLKSSPTVLSPYGELTVRTGSSTAAGIHLPSITSPRPTFSRGRAHPTTMHAPNPSRCFAAKGDGSTRAPPSSTHSFVQKKPASKPGHHAGHTLHQTRHQNKYSDPVPFFMLGSVACRA